MATPNLSQGIRVAIYARVSTKDKRQDTENQLAQLRDFAGKQHWTVHREFVDHESGGKSERVEFQEMFTDASQGKFDLLLFWALDRLSREGVLETLQHLNRLTSHGVGFRSFTEQYFDSCGIFKEAVIAIMATLAKQERVRLSERTKAGLAIARLKGHRIGRPRLKVNPCEIARLQAQGLSQRAIGRMLGISDGSVRRMASAPA
jgi:DNA invertase Pin-like site-specific DNA recombinase